MCRSRPTPRRPARGDDPAGQLRVRRAEIAVQDAHEVDHGLLAAGKRLERTGGHDVGFDHVDRRQRQQVLGALAPPRRHRHSDATGRQRRHQMPADEPGAPQHQNVVQLHGVFAAASGSSSSSGSPAARAGTVPRRALIGVADLVSTAE